MIKNKRTSKKNSKGFLFIAIGVLLIAAALSLTAYNIYDNQRAGKSVKQVLKKMEDSVLSETSEKLFSDTAVSDYEPTLSDDEPTVSDESSYQFSVDPIVIPDYILNPNMEMPTNTIDGIDYIGVLRIPALELELPIISNWSYSNLKTAPCRYSGSAYQNNLIICGHDYTSHFGHLKFLGEGDIATFTDIDGNIFTYGMADIEILQPTAIEEMESGGGDLTLFTCTVGGQSRLTVRFELQE